MILKLFKIKLVNKYLNFDKRNFLFRVGLDGNLGHFGRKKLFIISVVRYDLKLFRLEIKDLSF